MARVIKHARGFSSVQKSETKADIGLMYLKYLKYLASNELSAWGRINHLCT